MQSKLDAGDKIEVFDVRGEDERATAKLDFAKQLDAEGMKYIQKLPKNTAIVFHCHHGGRSQKAAENFLAQGFSNVSNLKGGIDMWSLEIDPDVARY